MPTTQPTWCPCSRLSSLLASRSRRCAWSTTSVATTTARWRRTTPRGFNCRAATGSDAWSEHAYGRAIDINPIQNPFVTASGDVIPPAGEAHRDRDVTEPGLITSDGPVVAAFAGIGWQWGGEWARGQDYQHFSVSGR